MMGQVASLVVIVDSTKTTTEHPHQCFHARLLCACFSLLFFCVLNMPWRCNDDDDDDDDD